MQRVWPVFGRLLVVMSVLFSIGLSSTQVSARAFALRSYPAANLLLHATSDRLSREESRAVLSPKAGEAGSKSDNSDLPAASADDNPESNEDASETGRQASKEAKESCKGESSLEELGFNAAAHMLPSSLPFFGILSSHSPQRLNSVTRIVPLKPPDFV
jgi:hypothetical protein